MRIVNSIEREMVHSEWENWLADENVRCEQLKAMLDGDADRDKTAAEKMSEKMKRSGGAARKVSPAEAEKDREKEREKERREGLRSWYEGYCGSCKAERQAVAKERMSMTSV
jgi:hypothetical protein